MHHRRTGEAYGRQPLGERLNDEMHEAGVAVRILASRVTLDAPRLAAKAAHDGSTLIGLLCDEASAEAQLTEAMHLFNEAHDQIATALRTLPAPTRYTPLITSPIQPPDR